MREIFFSGMKAPRYILCRLFLMLFYGIAVIDLDAVLRIRKPTHLYAWRIGEAAFLTAVFFSFEIYRLLKRILKRAWGAERREWGVAPVACVC